MIILPGNVCRGTTAPTAATRHGTAVPPASPPAVTGKVVRLMAIGNSFTANATRFLPALANAAGHTLIYSRAAFGSGSLAQHWSFVKAFEKNPNDPLSRPYKYKGNKGNKDKKVSLREMLAAEKWDYVILQQFSYDSFRIKSYRPYAKNLYDYIKKYAPQAEVLFHQTWAYRKDDPMFKDGKFTQQQMFDDLQSAYKTIATELGCRIIPVGDAMQKVRQHKDWRFTYPDPNFDYANPKYPAKPNQDHSLNAGYRWTKNADGQWKLVLDAHHANRAGQYLAASIWFEVFYGQSVVSNSFAPNGLRKEDATFLRQMAHNSVTAGQ